MLRQRWKFLAGFDITATPSVTDGIVYFPSWNGNLYAVSARNEALIWQRNLGQLTGIPPTGQTVNVTVSRATPMVAGDLLIVGIFGPAFVVAVVETLYFIDLNDLHHRVHYIYNSTVTRATGQLVWTTRLDPGPSSIVTASGTVYRRGFYVGVSSLEELLPAAQCCTFRGSLVKMDVRTGRIIWQTYTLPDNGGRLEVIPGQLFGAAAPASTPYDAVSTLEPATFILLRKMFSSARPGRTIERRRLPSRISVSGRMYTLIH
ncbi:hypothetical protein ACS0TY_009940 [Phlomoides rotata]